LLAKEEQELRNEPDAELLELAGIYEKKGLKKETAWAVAKELTEHGSYAAHVEAELGIDPENLTNPWHAALASAGSFLIGAIIPLVAILIPPASVRIPVAFVSVLLALALTGIASAKVGDAPVRKATVRVVAGGALAMIVTYSVGGLFNATGL
jgi:VIT1/CCC1 family predicted Fe2+/Mn2+ transporter